MSDTTTPIADLLQSQEYYHRFIHENKERKHRIISNGLWQDHLKKQDAVEKMFGEINGWKVSEKIFTPKAINGKSSRRLSDMLLGGWMDQPICYRDKPRGGRTARNIAIVGQPYNDIADYRDELDEVAGTYNLRWHVPPMERASIWYPSWTLFIVMTVPDVEVKWLPEQVVDTRFKTKGGWHVKENVQMV